MGIIYQPDLSINDALINNLCHVTFAYPAIVYGSDFERYPDNWQAIQAVVELNFDDFESVRSDNMILICIRPEKIRFKVEMEPTAALRIDNIEEVIASKLTYSHFSFPGKFIHESMVIIAKINMNTGDVYLADNMNPMYHRSDRINWKSATPEEIAREISIDYITSFFAARFSLIQSSADLRMVEGLIDPDDAGKDKPEEFTLLDGDLTVLNPYRVRDENQVTNPESYSNYNMDAATREPLPDGTLPG